MRACLACFGTPAADASGGDDAGTSVGLSSTPGAGQAASADQAAGTARSSCAETGGRPARALPVRGSSADAHAAASSSGIPSAADAPPRVRTGAEGGHAEHCTWQEPS